MERPVQSKETVLNMEMDHHLETFSIVWIDGGNRKDQKKLRSLINHVKILHTIVDFQNYIANLNEPDRLVVIVNERLSQELVPIAHPLHQVSSISIYFEDETMDKKWIRNFPKV